MIQELEEWPELPLMSGVLGLIQILNATKGVVKHDLLFL